MAQDSKLKLIYIGDPMCSWCYGFGPELQLVRESFKEVDWEFVMGGLRPYNTETMTDLKSFLTHHWEEVHKAAKVPFSYEILDREDLRYDTEPPSRAVCVVKEMSPENVASFFKEVQRLFYAENKDLSQALSYKAIVEALELDFEQFEISFDSERMKALVRQDFARAGELGISGFPSIVLLKGSEKIIITRGYQKAAAIINEIQRYLD